MMQKRRPSEASMQRSPFVKAAKKGEWMFIDLNLAKLLKEPHVSHAYARGINHAHQNVRDLHFTVLQNSIFPKERFAKMRKKIARIMEKDRGRFSGFRAACTLAQHGPGEYRTQTIKILQSFSQSKDKDVSAMAKEYLAALQRGA